MITTPVLNPSASFASGDPTGLRMLFSELQSEVGYYLGYGRTAGSFSAQQSADVAQIIKDGERRVWNSFNWSCLHPELVVTTTGGVGDYDLPADFGGLESDITFGADQSWMRLERVSESTIRMNRTMGIGNGAPYMAAIRPLAPDHATGQHWELMLYPTPDTTYTLSLRYFVEPFQLSESRPNPYGGLLMSELIKASCLAEAETKINDGASRDKRNEFDRALANAIRRDREALRPHTYGTVCDPGMNRRHGSYMQRSFPSSHIVTVDGSY